MPRILVTAVRATDYGHRVEQLEKAIPNYLPTYLPTYRGRIRCWNKGNCSFRMDFFTAMDTFILTNLFLRVRSDCHVGVCLFPATPTCR